MKEDRRERLIAELIKASSILGHTPSSAEFDNLRSQGLIGVSRSSYTTEFGSWANAVTAAGLILNESHVNLRTYTDEELLSRLHEFVEEKGYLPTQNDFLRSTNMPSWYTYISRFGSIKAAYSEIGYKYDRSKNDLSEEGMINGLKSLGERLGRIPTARDLGRKNGVPCRRSFERIFGSWNAALLAAGFVRESKETTSKKNRRMKYNKAKMLRDYHELVKRLGRHPAIEELGSKNGTACYRTYVKVFGSWHDFLDIVNN